MANNLVQGVLKLDCTDYATLIECLECPAWRELRPTRAAALATGARHLKLAHGDVYAARTVQWLSRRRDEEG